MPRYKKLLTLVDLSSDSDSVARAGCELAADFGAAMVILHVVEYISVDPVGDSLITAVQFEDQMQDNARDRLNQLIARLGLEHTATRVEVGNTKAEILRVAAEESADLIVVGSHERHGLAILLNQTEDTVLHAAHCDVLAIRLK